MKISVDAGALCVKKILRFGNYSFTRFLLEAMQKYDRQNEYFVYSFCQKPLWLKSNKKMQFKILRPKTLWLSTRVSFEEIKQKKDIFLALNQAIPLKTPSQVIAFSHGLSFLFFPRFYPDSYYSLKDLLRPMVKKSRYVVVSSWRVRKELKKLFPNFKDFEVISYGVPFDMLKHQASTKKNYFLFVGMNHPIKKFILLKGFKQFRQKKRFANFKLFLIGNLEGLEDKDNNIYAYSNIARESLRKLYAQATGYLTTSHYESFNFPVLEALSQNCPVIGVTSAIIPEFKEYVHEVDNLDEFVEEMEKTAQGKITKEVRDEVIKRFSWEKYITKLKKLYESI